MCLSPYNPVDLMIPRKNKLRHIGTILACDTGDESTFHFRTSLVSSFVCLFRLLGRTVLESSALSVVEPLSLSNRGVISLELQDLFFSFFYIFGGIASVQN